MHYAKLLNLSLFASVLIGIVAAGCSTIDPTPVGLIPKTTTTTESDVNQGAPTTVPTTTLVVQSACNLTGGGVVQDGWSGGDTGTNSCNRCFCTDGVLGCTKRACLANPAATSPARSADAKLPDIGYFAENKSDRFLVDFEDIISGHPYVGQRSPVPHNDAQVYFSNTDPRWLNTTKPSDYPPVYAVADGIVRTSSGTSYLYNLRDKTFHDPPWWHVKYDFNLEIATDGDTPILFMYSMEPQILFDGISASGKPKDFYSDFVLVRDGQKVKKGDVLAYMYVPPLEERVTPASSSHISFALKKEIRSSSVWDMYAPAIFTEEIVRDFSDIYRNPKEGWDSASYGRDWARGRGVPAAMGWMISADENPFGDYTLDVLIADGVKDKEFDGQANIDSMNIGFSKDDLLLNVDGSGDYISNILELDEEWRVMVVSKGGPSGFFLTINEQGKKRENLLRESHGGQGYNHGISKTLLPGSYSIRIEDPENWGWAFAVAPSEVEYAVPGGMNPIGFCPPGCPPLPSHFSGKPAYVEPLEMK